MVRQIADAVRSGGDATANCGVLACWRRSVIAAERRYLLTEPGPQTVELYEDCLGRQSAPMGSFQRAVGGARGAHYALQQANPHTALAAMPTSMPHPHILVTRRHLVSPLAGRWNKCLPHTAGIDVRNTIPIIGDPVTADNLLAAEIAPLGVHGQVKLGRGGQMTPAERLRLLRGPKLNPVHPARGRLP